MKRSNALWGTLLIFAGILWILDSTNTVTIDIWGSIMVLWPVFIIAAGITFFLKNESHVQRVILWILVFAMIGGYGIYLGNNGSNEAASNKKFMMKPEFKSAAIKISATSADFDIAAGNEYLADVKTNVKNIISNYDESINPKITFSQKMQFKGWNKRQNFKAGLNSTIPWDIEINTGAAKGNLDFEDLPLRNCTINTGACELDIRAGSKQKDAKIVINGAAVSVNLNIPENIGVKINSSSAATKINGNVTLLKEGKVYQSDNFASADNKLYLDIASAASNINVNR